MKHHLLVLLAAGALGAVPAVHAHHSVFSDYLVDRKLTIEGEVLEFVFRNPHSSVHLLVRDRDGEAHRWAAEWNAASQLHRAGVTPDTLRAGDHVIISGYAGRLPEDRRLLVRRIVRPQDGWEWTGPVQ